MAKRYLGNRAILAKMETVYGTSSAPTALLNAMQMANTTFEPLLGTDIQRGLVLPTMGNQGIILDGNYARLQGEVEMAGSGTLGTPPKFAPLLRSCGLQEVVDEDVSVSYTPISTLFESSTLFFNMDGVNHVMLGARGTVTLQLQPLQIPRFTFTLTGLVGPITDVPVPGDIDLDGFVTPVPVNKANSTLSLHGLVGAAESLSIDLANSIEPRFLIGSESIEQTDRQSTGSAVLEAVLLAQKNWFQIAQSHTLGTLAAQHGTVAGNIVELSADGVQIGRPTYGDTQRIINNTLPLILTPKNGNELTITFR